MGKLGNHECTKKYQRKIAESIKTYYKFLLYLPASPADRPIEKISYGLMAT